MDEHDAERLKKVTCDPAATFELEVSEVEFRRTAGGRQRVSLLAPLGVRTPMLGDVDRAARASVGPIKDPEEVADMVVAAVEAERFLILTDPIAQKWMDYKNDDIERWLNGMRRQGRKSTSGGPNPSSGRRLGR